MSNLVQFALDVEDAQEGGIIAAYRWPDRHPDDSFSCWVLSHEAAWFERVNAQTRAALQDVFRKAWLRFSARRVFADSLPGNANNACL